MSHPLPPEPPSMREQLVSQVASQVRPPAKQPVDIPPYAANTGSANGLRMVQTQAASLWIGVPVGDPMIDSMTDITPLVRAVYDTIGHGDNNIPTGMTGSRTSVSDLQPSDIVAWNGGWRGQDYIGHLAVYMGNGEIMEQVGNQPPSKRTLQANENAFGVHLNI